MKTTFFGLSLILAGASICQGALLTTFSFTGANGDESSFAADSQPANAVVSTMTRGTGITPSANGDHFSASSWTTSSSRDLNDYYEFTVTPNSGFLLTLTRLELDERRSSTGIANWAIYSSLDLYGTSLATFTVPDNTAIRTDEGVNLGTSFSGLTSAVTFRIYGYTAEMASGTWFIDNVDLSGSLTPTVIPEPAEWGMISALGLLSISGVSTWRKHCAAKRSTLA
jgi:hypothetical protein